MVAVMDEVRKSNSGVVKQQESSIGEVVLQVRRLTEKDHLTLQSGERILKVIMQLMEKEGGAPFNVETLDFTVLNDPNTWVLGIFEGVMVDGKFTDPLLIGMATANFKHTWTGWKMIIDDFIINKESRGKGFGRALNDAMEDLARQHNPSCKSVVLTSDRDDAFAFYSRIGYVNRGEQQFKKRLSKD